VKSKCRANSSPSCWAWPSRAHRTCLALCLYIMRARVGAHEASQASRSRQRVSMPAACYRHRGSYPPPSIVPLPLLARRHSAPSHTRLLGTFVAGLRASAPTVTFSTGRAPGVATSSSVRRPSARRSFPTRLARRKITTYSTTNARPGVTSRRTTSSTPFKATSR